MSKFLWYLKQLLPLTYWTRYGDHLGLHFVIWRMWFGRCFSITDITLGFLSKDTLIRNQNMQECNLGDYLEKDSIFLV